MRVRLGKGGKKRGFLLAFWASLSLGAAVPLAFGVPQIQDKSKTEEKKPEDKPEAKTEKKDEGLPLKTTRKISFTTDEGTWVSLDPSPDGKQIVFDLLGDLYLISTAGGEAKRMTDGPAWDFQPRFSPDGKQIAFISDRSGSDNLWIINVDGTGAKKVSDESDDLLGSPAWSPDGNYIITRKYGPYPGNTDYLRMTSLWLFHKNGGKGIELVKGKGETAISSGAVFSPDGKLVYFSSHAGTYKYNADIGRFQVYTFNRDTGEVEKITSEYGGGLRPIVSPDGKWLVYASRHDAKTGLRIRDLATREEHWLALPIQRDDQEGFAVNDLLPGYSFTPDSKSVLFTRDGHIQRVDIATHQVSTISFTAKVDQDLGPRVHTDWPIDDGPLTVHQMRWTNQSPDGKQIVFSAVGKIWAMNLPDGKPRRLTSSSVREYSPTFSRDGKWVAYVSWSDENGGELWKVSAAGGAPVKLSGAAGYYSSPQWSPDGSKLVFIMGSKGGFLAGDAADIHEVRWVSADGGPSHNVVALAGDGYQQPTFNGDGTRVYYMEDVPPPPEGPGFPSRLLRSVRLDGVDKKTHFKLEGGFVLMIPSPDGEWVAIQDRYDAYLAPFPKIGDATINLNLKAPAVPVKRVTREGANYIYWADGGKTLTWSFGNDFYRVSRDTVLQAEEPEKKPSDTSAAKSDEKSDGKFDAKSDTKSEPKPPAWKPETFAIALQVPPTIPGGKLYLRGARLVTMKGEEIIERGDILIENNRIKALGPSSDMRAPSDAKVMDVRGKTIIPGLVDIHSHLKAEHAEMTDEEWSYAANLAFGVTTTRDPSIESNAVFAQGELVSAGDLVGPRIYSTGTAITTEAGDLSSLEDAENLVKRYKTHGADSLKEYMQPRRVVRQWLAMAAAKEGVNITAEGGGDLKTDLTMVLDGYTGVEHSLPVVSIYKDVIELEAQAGTTYTPTLIVSYGAEFGQFYWRQRMNIHEEPKVMRFTPHEQVDSVARRRPLLLDEEYTFPLIAQGAAGVVRAGGHVGLGSHGEQQGIGAHWELWMLQSGGMTPWQALNCATMNGAESIGLEKQLGSLEPGKLADLLVLNSNPVDDIHNSRDLLYVVKNGVVYSADSLDEIWPAQKKFPPFFWHKEDAELQSLPH
jgi:Tol biopolymer transport system component/imidazolonepropionase-like amidohydrolase